MKQKIGILGSGVVAKALAKGFNKHGYEVMMGTREASKLDVLKDIVKIDSFRDTAAWGEIIVLAVKGTAAEDVLKLAGLDNLKGKTVIDTTNPIAEDPPENGVLKFFTSLDESLLERLQKLAPGVSFVKAFSIVGNAFMVDPAFPEGKPTMFICGNNADARQQVTDILIEVWLGSGGYGCSGSCKSH